MERYSALFFTLVMCLSGWAQSNRYIVTFKDKSNSAYSLSDPAKYLSERAIARRVRNGVPIVPEDLPVNASYVSQVRATGVSTFFTSRWMNAVLVEATPAQIGSVMGLPCVSNAEMVAPGKKLIGGRLKNVKQKNATPSSNATAAQLQMIGLDSMHADGFLGKGILISFFDGGFPGVNAAAPFQPVFAENRVMLTQDFVANSGNVYQYDKHGTEVFSVVAGLKSAAFEGGAYQASYMLFVTEDPKSEYRVEEYNWLFAAERADSAGTDIIQSSLGYNLFDDPAMNYKVSDLNGKTAIVSKAASMALARGIVVVASAGNEGNNNWHFITPPADVNGILAVGAVTLAGVRVNFSSTGPTSDGRIKPDVVAVGSGTSVIDPDGSISTASGTSLAAPLVTSLVAGLMEKYPSLLPAEIVNAIMLSASKSNSPDNLLGYGIPNYIAVRNYLESNSAGEDVFLFPNPADSSLSLSFKKLPEGNIDLSFYDAQGKLLANPVQTVDWLNNPVQISLENLAAGTYLLKVRTSTLIRTFRFVKL